MEDLFTLPASILASLAPVSRLCMAKPAQVYLIDDKDACDQPLALLREPLTIDDQPWTPDVDGIDDEPPPVVLGLDAEWVPGPGQDVAVLQLSNGRVTVVLLLHRFARASPDDARSAIPACLAQLLGDSKLLKTGVGISQDCIKLFESYGLETTSAVELDGLVHRSPLRNSLKKRSLRAMVHATMDLDLPKDKRVTCSNWKADPLTIEQVVYAATDAYVSRAVFVELFKAKSDKRGMPWTKGAVAGWVHGLSRTPTTKHKESRERRKRRKQQQLERKQHRQQQGDGDSHDGQRTKKVTKLPHTKRLYENCKLYGPDGKLLAACDRKKLRWYLSRGLGQPHGDDGVMLNFQPAGNGNADDPFYMTPHINQCVRCGVGPPLRRYSIVPPCYRRSFPAKHKSHSSHDVVLMCHDCHVVADQAHMLLRRQLADEYDVPLDINTVQGRVQASQEELQLRGFRSACNALVKHQDKLPPQRLEQLWQRVERGMGKPRAEISRGDLLQGAKAKIKMTVPPGQRHGAQLVRKLYYHDEDGKRVDNVFEFVKRCRQHFLDEVKPEHLHPHWSVEHVRLHPSGLTSDEEEEEEEEEEEDDDDDDDASSQ